MASPFVGEIRIVPFYFAPVGWALCNGQLLPINQYTALFSLLGIQFGGNGTSNFGLPNFQALCPIGQGYGAGLTPRNIGDTGGEAAVTLTANQIPAHTHTLQATSNFGITGSPSGNLYAEAHHEIVGDVPLDGESLPLYHSGAPNATANAATIVANGTGHNNMQPFLVLNFIIALQGVFPPRS